MNTIIKKSAIISEDKTYRYVLSRTLNDTLPKVAFVGLNPSTADAEVDDPTIEKCIKYCKSWGYGGFYMVNLFALRSTDRSQIYNKKDPIGSQNDFHLKEVFSKVDKVICTWGNDGVFKERNKEVLQLISNPFCLQINVTGEPSHPLYLKGNLLPIPYQKETIALAKSKGKLKRTFNQQLKELASDLGMEVNNLDFKPRNWSNHFISFSYEMGGIIYGIKRLNPDKNKSRLVEIENTFEKAFHASEWWPMYNYFYSDINKNFDFWNDINNGNAKGRAKLFMEKILSKFNTYQY